MYTPRRYANELKPLLTRYKSENIWFRWWDANDTNNIQNAWRMYRRSSLNALGFLLLGDTAIRTKRELLTNFGLTSAHGVQEQKDMDMIHELMEARKVLAAPTRSKAVTLLGSGSILSDRNWSPLLNDSFVLGGVNACQEFHLSDEDFGGFTIPTSVASRSAMFGGAASSYSKKLAEEKWKAYFRAHPKIFFESFGPRVFAREVLGMMTFGYKPVYHDSQMSFICVDESVAKSATFTGYCNTLRDVNFNAADRDKIMSAISNYLFGSPTALTKQSLW